MFELDRFGLSPLGVDVDELEQDMANALEATVSGQLTDIARR
jgi:hypothetical protein